VNFVVISVHEKIGDKPADPDDLLSDSLVDEKDDVKRFKPKDQGVVEADNQKENKEIYDGSLELKIDESTDKHNGSVVDEADHEPWGKEPNYGYQYDQGVVENELTQEKGCIHPKVAKSSLRMTKLMPKKSSIWEDAIRSLSRKPQTTLKFRNNGKRTKKPFICLAETSL
jgi:hypothetical protein